MGAFGSGALANGNDDHTGTTAPVGGDTTTYGGPNTKYAGKEPGTAGRFGTSKPAGPEPQGIYSNQQPTGTGYYTQPTGTSTMTSDTTAGYTEMDASQAGAGHDPHMHHNPNPYAEINQGGYVHSQPQTGYAR